MAARMAASPGVHWHQGVSGSPVASDESWLRRELPKPPHPVQTLADDLVAHEREMIETALAASGGHVSGPSGAAAKLGIPGSTLDSKIRALGIRKERFRGV
jgi:formate hydrogenlyase transcriptional activator